jgi:hypothetical protein
MSLQLCFAMVHSILVLASWSNTTKYDNLIKYIE